MRRFTPNSSARRRGQALLLAVLIMIFAALLSAAFIGIVAVNLNQTARQTDKNIARDNARSGLAYINSQLSFGALGDRWNPTLINKPPVLTTDYKYGFYYTAFDISQGWATNGYSKFPDPRGNVTDGPQYLAKVERLPLTLEPSNPDFDKAGALKITVIGLSPEDPTAFHRIVAYKGGAQRSPLGHALFVVPNFDHNTKQVLVGKYTAGANGTTGPNFQLRVTDATGDFFNLARPFTITVSNPAANQRAVKAVVSDVVKNSDTDYTFNLAQVLPVTPSVGSRIELAANLGVVTGVDDDNDGTSATPTAKRPFALPDIFSDSDTSTYNLNQVDSAIVNAGLVLTGNFKAERLRRPVSSFYTTLVGGPGSPPLIPGYLKASGCFALEPTGQTVNVNQISGGTAYADTLRSSDNAATGVFTTSLTPDKDQMVGDGWERLKGPTANTSLRSTPDFIPPTIDSGAGLARYRDMARKSLSTDPTQPQSSLYGYGTGVYIDNYGDTEKVLDAGVLKEMTQTQLTQMWLSSTTNTTTNYHRNGTPVMVTPPTVPTASLEEMHLRGWVGPDEFRARGVEIVLEDNGGTPQLRVTRDARSDGANYNGSLNSNAWKNPATGAIIPGRYTQILPWPATGVIFAEGNIRIKGKAPTVPTNSLTVVSMGNIYIEDSLSIDDDDDTTTPTPRKILLMAKKNVVMNPTRVLSRPDETTTSSAATLTAPNPATLTVADTTNFRVDDIVESLDATGAVSTVSRVTAINPTTQQLTVLPLQDGTIVANAVLRSRGEVRSNVALPTLPYSQIGATQDSVNRRFTLPTPNTTGIRLAFDHQANRTANIFVVGTTTDIAPTKTSWWSYKRVMETATPANFNKLATNVTETHKNFQGDFRTDGITTGIDNYSGNNTLDDARTAITTTSHPGIVPGTEWKYTVNVLGGYQTVKAWYLASVGNRYDFMRQPLVVSPPAGGDGWRADIINSEVGQLPGYDMPLATSISVFINGAQPILSNETWNGTTYDQTNQFGFNPSFLDLTAAPPTLPEDILTGDQGFYQTDSNRSTVDSRLFATGTLPAGNHSIALQQSRAVTLPTGINLPAYRLLGVKLENVVNKASSNFIDSIAPAHDFEIQAYVYAQNGSWFVIPTPMFEPRLKGTFAANGTPLSTYFDYNNNGVPDNSPLLRNNAEYLEQTTPAAPIYGNGDFADLNRNGIIEDNERYAVLRYSRYNYSIKFIGSITENQTPLIEDVPGTTVKGAVATWSDRLASINYVSTLAAKPVTYDRIKYIFDPSLAQGSLDAEPGFLVPQTEELFGITG